MTEREYAEYIEECNKSIDDFNRIAKRLGVDPTGGDMPINMAFILKLLRAIEKVLDSQASTDAVSRTDIDEMKEIMTDIKGNSVYAVRMEDIRKLPSVTPKPNLEQIYSDLLRVKHNTMNINELIDKVYADMREGD